MVILFKKYSHLLLYYKAKTSFQQNLEKPIFLYQADVALIPHADLTPQLNVVCSFNQLSFHCFFVFSYVQRKLQCRLVT